MPRIGTIYPHFKGTTRVLVVIVVIAVLIVVDLVPLSRWDGVKANLDPEQLSKLQEAAAIYVGGCRNFLDPYYSTAPNI